MEELLKKVKDFAVPAWFAIVLGFLSWIYFKVFYDFYLGYILRFFMIQLGLFTLLVFKTES